MRYTALLSAALISNVYSAAVPEETTTGGIEPMQGMKIVWSDDFSSNSVDTSKWKFAEGKAQNNEQQLYGEADCHVSGGSLKILPKKTNGQWTSCRLETLSAWAPPQGGSVTYAAKIRLGKQGDGGNMQGVWPAFWTLGESMRHGTAWPGCGEIDTMENINGDGNLHGTAHCGMECEDNVAAGTFKGNGQQTPLDRSNWNVYAHTVSEDSITWYLNGKQYHQISKDNFKESWDALQKKFYVILNVAMGGNWPGNTVDDTVQGAAAGMEVQYVAVYQSA